MAHFEFASYLWHNHSFGSLHAFSHGQVLLVLRYCTIFDLETTTTHLAVKVYLEYDSVSFHVKLHLHRGLAAQFQYATQIDCFFFFFFFFSVKSNLCTCTG